MARAGYSSLICEIQHDVSRDTVSSRAFRHITGKPQRFVQMRSTVRTVVNAHGPDMPRYASGLGFAQ